MKLHRFNDRGVDRFHHYLDSLEADPSLAVPSELLTDQTCVELVSSDIEVQQRPFANRMDAAQYLDSVLKDVTGDIQRDVGLWSWLSLFFFDQVCPMNGSGRRKLNERAWYIPLFDDHQRCYRHSLSESYRVFRANRDNPERAMVFLFGPLTTLGHLYYQLASRRDLITNPVVVGVATRLYFDAKRVATKRRSTSQKVQGSVFRYASILMQFDVTWDLHVMSETQLIEMLPSEFDEFR